MKSKLTLPALRSLCLYKTDDTFKQLVEHVECFVEKDLEMEAVIANTFEISTIVCTMVIFICTVVLFRISHPTKLTIAGISCTWLICLLVITRNRIQQERRKLFVQARRLFIAEYLHEIIAEINLVELHQKALNDPHAQEGTGIHCFFQSVREILELEEQDVRQLCTKRLRNFTALS